MKRRNFIQLTATVAATPFIATKSGFAIADSASGENTVILFQGDSITDASRDKKNENPNRTASLGQGYTLLASGQLMKRYPELKPVIYNRGVSGNKVYQMADRWGKDMEDLEPDVLSILIGVNDHWHTLNGSYNGTEKKYREDYDTLLKRTKNRFPDVKLIIGEPFILTQAKSIKEEEWIPVFDGYRNAARELAEKYEAVFIPYQSIFDRAISEVSWDYWAPDGVHPSLAGAQLMADHWIKAFDRLRTL